MLDDGLLLYLTANGSSQLGHSPDIVRIIELIHTLINNTYRLVHPLRLRSQLHTKFLLLIESIELLWFHKPYMSGSRGKLFQRTNRHQAVNHLSFAKIETLISVYLCGQFARLRLQDHSEASENREISEAGSPW